MNSKLLTQKDLAERWQVTVEAISNWRKEGIIAPAKGVPAIRFTQEYIAELEGVKLEKFSPLERRKMEIEINELKSENEKLKLILTRMVSEGLKAVTLQV